MFQELNVLPVSHATVPDYSKGVTARRYVGYSFKADAGPAGGFEMIEEAVKLKANNLEVYHEFLKEIRLGNLLPADEATAKLAGVKWEDKKPEVKKEEKPLAVSPAAPVEPKPVDPPAEKSKQ